MFYASSSNNCNAFYSTYLSMHCVPHVLYIFTIVKTCCTLTNGRTDGQTDRQKNEPTDRMIL